MVIRSRARQKLQESDIHISTIHGLFKLDESWR